MKNGFGKRFAAAFCVLAAIFCVVECVLCANYPEAARELYGAYLLAMVILSSVGALLIAALSGGGGSAAGEKENNREIQRLTMELEHLQELASRREDFIASFAHELKTPLTAIIGYADMLRSKEMPPKSRFTAAGYIFSEGKRLEALSLKLLDIMVVGKQDFEKRRYDAGVLIREVAAVTVPSVSEEGISLDIRWEKAEIAIEPDLFKTLLINLVDNARKASKRGQSIELFGKNEEEGYAFYVRDYGRGMKQEDIEKITEPFYMVDKSRSRAQNGAGLGLALCKRIAQLHGTSLEYASQPGQGTTVRVLLAGGEQL